MRKIFELFITIIMLSFLVTPAYAAKQTDLEHEVSATYVDGAEWLTENSGTGELVVDGYTVLRFSGDAEIRRNIRVESGSGIEITNGAKVVLISSHIFCEQGSYMDIVNGMLKLSGDSHMDNLGTVTTHEKGILKIYLGSFSSCQNGLVNNGKITCLSSGKSVNNVFSSIKKSDDRFSLSDYSLHIKSNGSYAAMSACYCIGKAQTNYRYTAALRREAKTTVKRTRYSMDKVYSRETTDDVLDRITNFEMNFVLPQGFADGFHRQQSYTYSYNTNELLLEITWFNYDPDEDIYYEGLDSHVL